MPKAQSPLAKRRKGPAKKRIRYRGWCEACHRKGKWCGFDHEKLVFVRGKQAERERMRQQKELREALGGLSTKQKVTIRKMLQKFKAKEESARVKKKGTKRRSIAERTQEVTATIMDPESLFASLDASSDGQLDAKEFSVALRKIGMSLSDAEAMDVFKCLDKDSSGTVSLEEFGAIVAFGRNIYKIPASSKLFKWTQGKEERVEWLERSKWVARRRLRRYCVPIIEIQRICRGYLVRKQYIARK